MSVGFTGTREGMTDLQKAAVKALLTMLRAVSQGCDSGPDWFHHGDCIGADSDFHDICVEMGFEDDIRIHPPENSKHRAYKFNAFDFRRVRDEKPYLERNRDIVEASRYGGVLIACPKAKPKDGEVVTGGTWYTVEYALKKRVPVIVVWPDGAVERLGVQ